MSTRAPDRVADPRAIAVLTLALLGVSLSGPLVRLSQAHPLAIAAWRLAFSLVVVALGLIAFGASIIKPAITGTVQRTCNDE